MHYYTAYEAKKVTENFLHGSFTILTDVVYSKIKNTAESGMCSVRIDSTELTGFAENVIEQIVVKLRKDGYKVVYEGFVNAHVNMQSLTIQW